MMRKIFLKMICLAKRQNNINIKNCLEKKENSFFLDLGCDDGEKTLARAKKIQTDEIFGIEIVEERIKLAEEKRIKVFKEDLNKKLSFDNDFFDIIIADQIIEHLYDTDNFLEEIYRILKPGGYAIISTENLSSWHNVCALILGFQPFSMANFSNKGSIVNPFSLWKNKKRPTSYLPSFRHNRLFSYYGLKDLVQKHGFKIEKVIMAGYYPLWNKLSRIDPIHGHFFTIKIIK